MTTGSTDGVPTNDEQVPFVSRNHRAAGVVLTTFRPARVLAVCLATVALASWTLAAQAQQFYKWKDASGATHYSDRAPPSGAVTTVTVTSPVAAGATVPTPPADPSDPVVAARRRACLTAKNNLNILQGEDVAIASGDAAAAVEAKQRRSAARERAMNAIGTNCEAGS